MMLSQPLNPRAIFRFLVCLLCLHSDLNIQITLGKRSHTFLGEVIASIAYSSGSDAYKITAVRKTYKRLGSEAVSFLSTCSQLMDTKIIMLF